ncbi:hypothetical protein HYR99_25395 [Candidatus Poribacteria bacterium]|nr:hypothetical protein [Candidatus Poribacteria bacterium]
MNRPPKKVLYQVREAIQLKHNSIRTKEAYVAWMKRYIKQHPNGIQGAHRLAFRRRSLS